MGGPPLEFINIQPKKGGPPLNFINQMGVRLISENQGLEKLRKISGPAHLDFFLSVCHLDLFQVYGTYNHGVFF